MAESNRAIEGYPVASITVPTERSTHYGLRPAPGGSGGGMPLANDSAFVQVGLQGCLHALGLQLSTM